MKIHLLWILFITFSSISNGQTKIKLTESFYNLPINSSRSKIKDQIISDKRFINTENLDTSLLLFNNNSYLGYITDYNLPTGFEIDSASIELTWGYGMNKMHKRNHNLTFIRLTYFVTDSVTSSALANMFWNRHKSISSDTFEVTIGRTQDNNLSYGNKINIKSGKYLPTLSVLQQKYTDKTFAVKLEYERLGD